MGGGTVARGIQMIHGWRDCRQRDSEDSEVEGLSPEGFVGFIGGGAVDRDV